MSRLLALTDVRKADSALITNKIIWFFTVQRQLVHKSCNKEIVSTQEEFCSILHFSQWKSTPLILNLQNNAEMYSGKSNNWRDEDNNAASIKDRPNVSSAYYESS